MIRLVALASQRSAAPLSLSVINLLFHIVRARQTAIGMDGLPLLTVSVKMTRSDRVSPLIRLGRMPERAGWRSRETWRYAL